MTTSSILFKTLGGDKEKNSLEIQNTFERFPSKKKKFFTDKPSCSNQLRVQILNLETPIIYPNLIQIIEDNFNEIQINKLGTQNNRWKIRNQTQPYYPTPSPNL